MTALDAQRSTILIVDDEPENIWPLVKFFEKEYEVLCAGNGEQALKTAFSQKKPDVILLDIMLPDIDGYEVCSRLKADTSTQNIPIIFLTGKREEEAETRGFETGAQDYIVKPFSLEKVKARVRSVLNLKKELDRRISLRSQLEELNRYLEGQITEKRREMTKLRATLEDYEKKYNRLFASKTKIHEKKRILVVDDAPENVHLFIKCLEPHYEICCASTGEDALKLAFSTKPPDLILLDIMMPGMDGYEVCSRLKANKDTWNIPIIFVSALGQEVDETKGLDYGAVDYITKPFNPSILKARIKAALRLKDEMDQRIILTGKLEDLNKKLEEKVKFRTLALKQASDELRASEKKYRDIYENAPEGIYQSTFGGRFLTANPALVRILGYDSQEELIEHMADIRNQLYVHPEKRDELRKLLGKQESVVGFEIQLYRKDGTKVWASVSTRIVRDKEGHSLYIEGFLTDITEKKQLEEQLRQAAKMEAIGKLISGISHDFNNMITPVIGFSELLLNSLSLSEKDRRFLKVIKKSGDSAAELTKRLLAFSRKQIIHPQLVNLNQVIDETKMMLKPMLGEDIILSHETSENLHNILADRSEIEQVVMNLVVNARDAMPGGGKLTITTENVHIYENVQRQNQIIPHGDYVMMVVNDTGIGMSDDVLKKIFEPFFTTKKAGKGTGIGLATVHGIVKQYRGYITVQSRRDEGTSFKIYFPAIEDAEVTRAIKTDVDHKDRGTETIMVVDDDINICLLAEAILRQQGYTVLVANNGKMSLCCLDEYSGPLDLLLADVVMPDTNGRDLFEDISKRYHDLKVVFMSGYADNVIVSHGILEEGTEFIQKPFGARTLAAKVRTVLDG